MDENIQKIKYTAFLDVLGFSDYMTKNITNDNEAQIFYENIKDKLINYFQYVKVFKDKFSTDIEFNNSIFIDYKWISDTFIVTIKYDGKNTSNEYKYYMIDILSRAIADVYHFFALKYNLMIRGAISSKYTFINDKLILGEGISESARLEKDIAVHPRVIFADNIITEEIIKFISSKHGDNDLDIISKDCDGYYFVNFIGALQEIPPRINTLDKVNYDQQLEEKIEMLKKYMQIAGDGLKHENPSVKSKYKWLDNYIKRLLPSDEKSCNMFAYNLFSKDEQRKLKGKDSK